LKYRRYIPARYLALVAALALVSACSRGGDQSYGERDAVPVLAAKSVVKTVLNVAHAIGRVEAFSTVNVKSQVPGQIMTVHFKEGQDVKVGDRLFTIDPRPYEALMRRAEANLGKDLAQQSQADSNERRFAYLLQQGVGSQQQYDQAKAEAGALDAAVAADKAEVEAAKLNLAYANIRSPINGRTGNLLVHAGNVVKANEDNPLVVINQLEPVYVTFSIPEQRLPEVRVAMAEHRLPVTASITGQPGPPIAGVLTFIDNTVDRQTGTISLKGTFDNHDGRLWPGQFVDVTMVLNERPNSIVIPSQAVQTGPDGSYVFVIDAAMKTATRPVVPGLSQDGQTTIERGLKAGETVVTDGQLRLIPGAAVTIKQNLAGT
jgi:multidrug efflux system membrane fusion protein